MHDDSWEILEIDSVPDVSKFGNHWLILLQLCQLFSPWKQGLCLESSVPALSIGSLCSAPVVSSEMEIWELNNFGYSSTLAPESWYSYNLENYDILPTKCLLAPLQLKNHSLPSSLIAARMLLKEMLHFFISGYESCGSFQHLFSFFPFFCHSWSCRFCQ